MKIHILVDFNRCETKVSSSAEDIEKHVISKEGQELGPSIWKILREEYLVEGRYLYSTAEFSFTTALVTEMKDALEHAELVLADPEVAAAKGYTADAKKKIFAVNDKIRRLQ
ncbi:hypothetical protein [Pseudodesulfovibrio pelocollis]|uniref:hypothetical protein n=1 Tax=Pseudodesulfovibrio pelocollis TaxID=3051432 RepID=UPI00255B04D4|nr:hypothetical protein [Pseudodesulfovibrio sp. SB368]